ncbi:MAG: hypothetical protein AAFP18_10500 [Bacteroidota bacterium]
MTTKIVVYHDNSRARQRPPPQPLPVHHHADTIPSTHYGQIHVTADVAPGDYRIDRLTDGAGRPFPGTVECDVLEEVETTIEFELMCARYDEAMANMDDMALASYYDA